jgi:hypothetical protein
MEEGSDMSTVAPTIPEVLSCILSPDPETGRWNGHCLDFDIATSGKDEEIAWNNLKLIVRHHIEECWERWPEGLQIRTASQERWKRFELLKKNQKMARQDKLHLNLVKPHEHEEDFWIQALEFPKDDGCGKTQSFNM